jgi:hypothetical protein
MSDERRRESSDVYSNARLINLLSMLYHCITTARRRGGRTLQEFSNPPGFYYSTVGTVYSTVRVRVRVQYSTVMQMQYSTV